jgi:hypothetical protein
MWYPNKAQWQRIGTMAAMVTVASWFLAVSRHAPVLLLPILLVDGGLVAWKRQRSD